MRTEIKIKIASFILMIMVLIMCKSLFCEYKGTLKIYTNEAENNKITLLYQKADQDKTYSREGIINQDGIARIKLNKRKIVYFQIISPKNLEIKKITFTGKSHQNIEVNQSQIYRGEFSCKLSIYNYYKLFVIAILSFYLFSFYLKALLNPQKEEIICIHLKMENIEFLRIIFTLCVICYHFYDELKIWNEGRLGVEFFFILSGFFLTWTFNKERTVLEFIGKKITRFLPVIVFAALVRSIFSWKLNISNMLSDFLFLPVPGLHNEIGYVNVAWYLSILIWASLFYFYILKYYKKETVNVIIGLIVFFSYVAIVSIGDWGARESVNAFIKINMLRGLGGMGLGYFLAEFMKITSIEKKKTRYKYSILEGVVLVYSFTCLFYQKIFPTNPFYVVCCFIVYVYYFTGMAYTTNFKDKVELFFKILFINLFNAGYNSI